MADGQSLGHRVVHTMKWNTIDKILSQALYAVTGIILANLLPREDFGLVGAVLVFQSFATLFCDSGFSYALIQRKHPTQTDYSTVLWFNLGMALILYILLYLGAPLIARCYHNDLRLIPLSRVMFLSFILNAAAVVQTNRLIKRMDVKPVTVSNNLGLFVGSVVGVAMALYGFGAWALVAQGLALAAVKALVLWMWVDWRPSFVFSWTVLRGFMGVGMGVMGSSFLNVLFNNIYSFFIGHRTSFTSLAYYTQGDKWSKMGISSLSSILTQTFLPVLSGLQDNPSGYSAATSRINRTGAFVLFPFTALIILAAEPMFHALFRTKWDGAIVLFQLLMLRGVFTVLCSLYHNYLLALGRSRLMFNCELLRDIVALVAIVLTLPALPLQTDSDPVYGIRIMLYGQLMASALTWVVTLIVAARKSWSNPVRYIMDLLPYAAVAAAVSLPLVLIQFWLSSPWLMLAVQIPAGIALYIVVCRVCGIYVDLSALSTQYDSDN